MDFPNTIMVFKRLSLQHNFSIHGNFDWWLFLTHFEAFRFRLGAREDFLDMLVYRE